MQYKEYKAAVNTFLRVQAYDTAILLQRRSGYTDVSYYTFADSTERTQYTEGRMLLIQNDPLNIERYKEIEKI